MISILGENNHRRTSATRKSMLSSLFRRAFALAVAIATGSSSIAITRFAPKRAAANARIPVPVPRSSNVLSGSGERRLPACWVRLPFLRSRKFLQPIARQLFDRPAKAKANFFQIAPAATGNFRDRTFAIWSRNNGEPAAPYFTQRRFVGCEPDRAGSLSPNEHQPTTKKIISCPRFLSFPSSPFSALTRRQTSRTDRCRG